MATITITRGLDPLISAFNQQSIEFTINTGVIPTVTIDSVGFLPVKTVTNVGGLDTYVMDLTDILPYYMGFPPKSFDVLTGLTKCLSVAVSGSVLSTFYQKREYYSGRDVYYLIPKKTMSVIEMLFYAKCISYNKYKYNYGRQANKTLKKV